MNFISIGKWRRLAVATALCIAPLGCRKPAAPAADVPARTSLQKASQEWPAPGKIVVLPSYPVMRITEPVAGGNLLLNAGFEAAQGGAPVAWTLESPRGSAALSSDYSTEGNRALRVDLAPDSPFEAWQEISATPRKPYVFRCMTLANEAAGRTVLEIRGPDGTASGFLARSAGVAAKADAWSLDSLRFTVPPFAKKLRFALKYEPDQAASGAAILWFDQSELFQLTPKNYILHGTFEDADEQGRAPTWWPNEPNLVGVSNDAYEGTHAKEIKSVEGSYLAVGPVDTAELPGKTVRLRVMVKATRRDKAGPAPATMIFRYKVGGELCAFPVEYPGDGEWMELSAQQTLPQDVDTAQNAVLVIFERTTNTAGSVLVDDAILEVVGP